MKHIDPKHDTRSDQIFTPDKLATMSPGDKSAIAAKRGYKLNESNRISHDSFLEQQAKDENLSGSTESGIVPDDFEDPTLPNYRDVAATGDSRHGSLGGQPPVEPLTDDSTPASGERASPKHTGVEEGSFTMGETQHDAPSSTIE